jgi:hypothetical protein
MAWSCRSGVLTPHQLRWRGTVQIHVLSSISYSKCLHSNIHLHLCKLSMLMLAFSVVYTRVDSLKEALNNHQQWVLAASGQRGEGAGGRRGEGSRIPVRAHGGRRCGKPRARAVEDGSAAFQRPRTMGTDDTLPQSSRPWRQAAPVRAGGASASEVTPSVCRR